MSVSAYAAAVRRKLDGAEARLGREHLERGAEQRRPLLVLCGERLQRALRVFACCVELAGVWPHGGPQPPAVRSGAPRALPKPQSLIFCDLLSPARARALRGRWLRVRRLARGTFNEPPSAAEAEAKAAAAAARARTTRVRKVCRKMHTRFSLILAAAAVIGAVLALVALAVEQKTATAVGCCGKNAADSRRGK